MSAAAAPTRSDSASASKSGGEVRDDATAALATATRFHSLDALRGLAALTVVFWHWQHFFYRGTVPGPYVRSQFPFYGVLAPFYAKGWLAVDLFFALSGFVFFWLYGERIRGGLVSAREFFALRFSRLYPLHLVTLIAVACGQAAFRRAYGDYLVYPVNDRYHFALNLLLASSWGLERGYSFNGPAWSVSVEMFLYAAFFVLCRLMSPRLVVLLGLSAIGHVAVEPLHGSLGSGIGSFFLGGSAHQIYDHLAKSGALRIAVRALVPATIAGWLFLAFTFQRGGNVYWPATLVVFPATILTLASLERLGIARVARLAVLGDVSYSLYLLHFPLQLAVIAASRHWGVPDDFFYTPGSMLVFFAVLWALAWASFHGFEMPARKWLRRVQRPAPSLVAPSASGEPPR